MKKFKVEIEQIREYIVEIDENIIDSKFIEGFESVMHELDEYEDFGDKYKAIAYEISRERIYDKYESFGYPLINGKFEGYVREDYQQKGINIIPVDEDYEDVTVDEIE